MLEHNVLFCPDGFNSGESVAQSELRQFAIYELMHLAEMREVALDEGKKKRENCGSAEYTHAFTWNSMKKDEGIQKKWSNLVWRR